MSSIILYKFRAQTNFEQISLPGSSARLFDIKRAIVTAKKLDKTGGMQMEFDLSVRNAMTEEEYTDENALIPRGTRVIVQRLPAAKGQGILTRIARADGGMNSAVTAKYGNQDAASSGFYTIESHKDDDEFVAAASAPQTSVEANSEEQELAALKAVTEQTTGSVYTASSHSRTSQVSKPVPSTGLVPPPKPQLAHFHQQNMLLSRPNADPELREQERLAALAGQPKKRATGIPRTFLSVSAPTVENEEGLDEETGATFKLQPNIIAFEALISRGGGQSESGSRTLDLDYALKLTATEIPEHLQCGICGQVVKNAMLIPWDPEGRTACEMCMRDGLAKNAYRCPLTGNEGVSPDDLLPNVGLRKAVDAFVKTVFEKMNEIILAQEAEDEAERAKIAKETEKAKTKRDFEGDSLDKGVVLGRRSVGASNQKRMRTAGDFGDDFGGDVFDVEPEFEENDHDEEDGENQSVSQEINEPNNIQPVSSPEESNITIPSEVEDKAPVSNSDEVAVLEKPTVTIFPDKIQETESEKLVNHVSSDVTSSSVISSQQDAHLEQADIAKDDSTDKSDSPNKTRLELLKNRAPPQGYIMGPAGVNDPRVTGGRGYFGGRQSGFQDGRGRFFPGGRFDQGRGFNVGRGGGRFSREGRDSYSVSQDDQSIEKQSYQSRGDSEAYYAKRFKADDSISHLERGGGRGERTCFSCGGTGHLARDCPQSKQVGRGFDHSGRGAPGRGADWHRGGRGGRFDDGGRGRDSFGRSGRGGGRWVGDGRGRF